MDIGKEPKMYETAPEPIDPDAYKNLTEDQKRQMEKLFAEDSNITPAEALKRVLGPSKEEQEES